MIEYLTKHPDRILIPLRDHLIITLITLAFSLALALLLTMLARQIPVTGKILLQIFSVIYSIPSLALFALLIPVTGLGKTSAVIVLVVYNQYLLLRNFLTGIDEVDPGIREAAEGIGMTKMQQLFKVEIPLAKQAILAGIRLSIVSTVGIATIASAINAGGLGDLLFDGLRTMNVVKILWGSILSAVLAVGLNAVLSRAAGTKRNDWAT